MATIGGLQEKRKDLLARREENRALGKAMRKKVEEECNKGLQECNVEIKRLQAEREKELAKKRAFKTPGVEELFSLVDGLRKDVEDVQKTLTTMKGQITKLGKKESPTPKQKEGDPLG
jgi:hypothetical protein